MKLSAMIAVLAISSSSFAATLANGIELKNLPTASKSYSVSLDSNSNGAAKIKAACEADKKAAEAFAVNSGSKVLLSKGCDVSLQDGYADQGGYSPATASTSFEVIFK